MIKFNLKTIGVCILLCAASIFIFNIVVPRKIINSNEIIKYKEPEKIYVDNSGITRTEFQAIELENKQFKEEVKSLKKQLKGLHNIQQVSKIETKIDTQFIEIPIQMITKDSFFIRKETPYVDLWASINTKTEKGDIGVYIKDTITHVFSYKGGIIRRGKATVTLNSNSNLFKFHQGNIISKKERRNVLSLSAGVYYDPFRNNIGGGIMLGIPIITIKK